MKPNKRGHNRQSLTYFSPVNGKGMHASPILYVSFRYNAYLCFPFINVFLLHISRHSKVSHFTSFIFSNQNISSGKVSMNNLREISVHTSLKPCKSHEPVKTFRAFCPSLILLRFTEFWSHFSNIWHQKDTRARALSVWRVKVLIHTSSAGQTFYEIAIVEGVYQNAKAKSGWKWGDLSTFFTAKFLFAKWRQSAPGLFEYTIVKYFSLQISMKDNSFHQQLAKKTSSTAVTSDLFVVWYLGLWNKCHLIHGSFSSNPEDPRTERTRSRLTIACVQTITKLWLPELNFVCAQARLTRALKRKRRIQFSHSRAKRLDAAWKRQN